MILLFVIAIAFIVYYFFNDIFKVEGEARLVKMELPVETQNLTISLDLVKMDKLEWKDALLIKGWVFKQNVKEKERDVYLVLKSDKRTLIFKIEKDNINRPDVTSYYKLNGGILNHGFEINVPLYLLKENIYQVGFVLSDATGKYYTMSSKELIISDGTVEVKNLKPEFVKPKSNQVSITLKVPTCKTKCGFEKASISDNNINIGGWGFLDGMNTDNMKSYVLLKKNETVNVYSVDVVIRKDVANFYKATGLNLDSSGFFTKIPVVNLEKGHYQVGVYIEKGNQSGMIYSNKYFDIGQ
ncbi:MAG: hypothetical protein M0Q38_11905 [Bacteroidales bacterium]|nr:hypothetical protein [Bacteroidales bacterium]